MTAASFEAFFAQAFGNETKPHDWQGRLALDSVCRNRLIRIPTGFGKTAGVAIAWLWNRVHCGKNDWPRRVVLCLPMRTLVEQTERAVKEWLEHTDLASEVGVHVLLGGLSPSDWHLEPERNAVLIGTQDMLLSRALNRGYGSGRARWPMEYGLLNVDCLWVMDEIQLMDVGLATSAQLQAFASIDEDGGKLPQPRRTWWMSATLQRNWLLRAPAFTDVASLPIVQLEPPEQTGLLWTVEKAIRVEHVPAVEDAKVHKWASVIAAAHKATRGGITLAVANTVKSARELHTVLARFKKTDPLLGEVDLRLVHSQFRGAERRAWTTEFLAREQCRPGSNRIIVATQVVEAGVDISADALVTELAPWASLVQRFGRCARYGGRGQIIVIDRRHSDESAAKIEADDDQQRTEKRKVADQEAARPYELAEIEAAAEGISMLAGAGGPSSLDAFEKAEEEKEKSLLPRLYPYAPIHILTRRELLDLFDTGPDLTGADIDISRFVREGKDRDLTVWWWPVPERERLPHQRLRPAHDALCRVPVDDAGRWLFGGKPTAVEGEPEQQESLADAHKARSRAWVWSYLDGNWERLEAHHIFPGQSILVEASVGGYDQNIGFTGKPGTVLVNEGHARTMSASDAADSAEELEELSEGLGASDRQYKTIATHGAEVAVESQKIAAALTPEDSAIRRLIGLAGIVHDVGKAHLAFAGAIRDRNGIQPGTRLAKAPKGRWHGIRNLYDHSPAGKRPGFRHELASALAIFELIWRAHPTHPALQGGREEVLDATVGRELPASEERILEPDGILADLIGLDETGLNLILYFVMSHHGKVRATLPMSPRDQENTGRDGSLPLRGVRDGDEIPAQFLADATQNEFEVPLVRLRLDPAKLGLSKRYGPSWVERVLALRQCFGSFQLAWLEALMRVADVRASKISRPLDSRLSQALVEVQATPDGPDRDADLRKWIKETVDAYVSRQDTAGSTGHARGRAAPRPSAKRSRRGAS